MNLELIALTLLFLGIGFHFYKLHKSFSKRDPELQTAVHRARLNVHRLSKIAKREECCCTPECLQNTKLMRMWE